MTLPKIIKILDNAKIIALPVKIKKKGKKKIGGQEIDVYDFGDEQQDSKQSQDEKSVNQEVGPILKYSLGSANTTPVFSSDSKSAFEMMANITVARPQIIATTDFIPCAGEDGLPNKFGEFLQSKQDALLLSSVDAIKTTIDKLNKDENAKNLLAFEKASLLNFFGTFYSSVEWLLQSIDDTKNSLNPTVTLPDYVLASFKANNQQFQKSNLAATEEIVGLVPQELAWTYTKTWIQMCLAFKDALNYGDGVDNNDSLFVNSENSDVNWKTNPQTVSSYNIVDPKNYNASNKIVFNDTQIKFSPPFLYPTEKVGDNYGNLKSIFTSIFGSSNNDTLNSIFNVPMSSFLGINDADKQKSFARLSYAITREIRYSSEIRRFPETFFNTYGYNVSNLSSTNNKSFLNYIIGESGKDITEISPAPTGGGNSLISLGQFTEGDFEILAFEKSYINDNVGAGNLNRPGSILTPGSVYLIDQSLNFSNNQIEFNLTNAKNFRNRLDVARTSLKKLLKDNNKNGFLFDDEIVPRTFSQVLTENTGKIDTIKAIKHPLLLLRLIEQTVINPVLPRSSPPLQYVKSVNYQSVTPNDASCLLISHGLKNSELMALLYMYVIGNVNSKNAQKKGNANEFTITNKLADDVETILVKDLGNPETSLVANAGYISVQTIKDQITNSKLSTLNRIAELIVDMLPFFEGLNPNAADPTPFNSYFEAYSFYSGIQKETLVTTIFYLCCLMLHEANPEEVVGLAKIENSDLEGLTIKIKKKGSGSFSGKQTINNNNDQLNTYFYDALIQGAEIKTYAELQKITRSSTTFLCFLEFLYGSINSFVTSLESPNNSFTPALQQIQQILLQELEDNNEVNIKLKELMTIRQLSLLKSKLLSLRTRLSSDYKSDLRNVVPYYTSVKDEPLFDTLLPIEDFSLVSWNYLLKDYFRGTEFGPIAGKNKKIISVGLPTKLYQSLYRPVDASASKGKNKLEIIKLKIYLTDYIRPTLIHKPIEFLFDLNLFNVKTLNYFVNKSLVFSSNWSEIAKYEFPSGYIKQFGFFNIKKNKTDQLQIDNAYDTYIDVSQTPYFPTFNDQTYIKPLINNHIRSFALSEYLRFVSGRSFDEYNFYRTSKLTKFNPETLLVQQVTPGSIEYAKNTLLVGSDKIISSLVQPKKFDRVFHVIVDPDNFVIDETATNELSKNFGFDIIDYYKKQGTIALETMIDDFGQPSDVIRRQTSEKEEIEIFGFSAQIEAVT